MPITIESENDAALVLFELAASGVLEKHLASPERNAMTVLEGKLESQLVEPFSSQYADLLASARASLVAKYGS